MRAAIVITALAVVTSLACSRDTSPFEVVASPSRTINVSVSQEFRVKLQSVGPGEYSNPPEISGSAIQFVALDPNPGLQVPAGVTQFFRFRAVASGQAILVFRHSGSNPTWTDTVVVR